MHYLALKYLHVTAVAVTGLLFFLRGIWMMRESPLLARRWVRIVPHVNDTVLLGAGLTMAYLSGRYPFVDGWLTAKVFGLIVYIILGSLALKHGGTKRARIGFWSAALATLGYIVAVAVTKNPNPFCAP
jgi:uncharacterized membrane protein SirB2